MTYRTFPQGTNLDLLLKRDFLIIKRDEVIAELEHIQGIIDERGIEDV